MPKIYGDKPIPEKQVSEEKHDAQASKKTMGVYDRPGRRGPSRGVIIAVVIAIVILIAIMLSTGFAQTSGLAFKAGLPDTTRAIVTSADVAVPGQFLIGH